MMPGTAAPFPMYNPETCQWMGMNMGMGMYPYPPFFAPMHRPEYYPNPMAYRGYRGVRGARYPRARGRGVGGRGRGGYQSHEGDYNRYDNYESDHYDQRRSKYSRSRYVIFIEKHNTPHKKRKVNFYIEAVLGVKLINNLERGVCRRHTKPAF